MSSSQQEERNGQRALWRDPRAKAIAVSIAGNCLLVVIKLLGAQLSMSAAMRADALHSASDILISGLVCLSFGIPLLLARRQHAAKQDGEPSPGSADSATAENLAALLLALLLIGAALGLLTQAATGYRVELERIPLAIALVWLCILISYFLARYKIRVGRETGSIAVEADGYHSKMDMWSSVVVLGGLLGDLVGIRLDTGASILVSLLIFKAGVEVLASAVRGLAASEAFTYQTLHGLRHTLPGRKAAALLGRLFRPHAEALRRRVIPCGHLAARHPIITCAVLIVLAVAGYAASGIYRIQPGESGVILRCGKLLEYPPGSQRYEFPPGVHYRLPAPLSRLYRIYPKQVRQLEFGFRTVAQRGQAAEPSVYLWESMHRTGIYEKVEPEAIVLTGDVNEVDLNLVVEYCIAPGQTAGFLFHVAENEALVRAATESTVRRTAGTMTLTDLLTTGRPGFEQDVSEHLQELLDEYGACVEVTAVHLQDVHPPVDIVSAFRSVATAREDRATSINEAKGYQKWTLPRSHGMASTILTDADAFNIEKHNNAEGDALYFNAIYSAFQEAPEVVAFTMYMDALEKQLPPLNKVILSDEISSEATGGTLQKYYMIEEFLKQGLLSTP